MGNSTSNNIGTDGIRASADAGVTQALQRCDATLEMLSHSMTTLTKQEAEHWDQAAAARDSRDIATAASLVRAAQQVARDRSAVRSRYTAIERQRSMLHQQQMNMVLTGVLVDTSKVMKRTQARMGAATASVDSSADVFTDIYDQMTEIGEAMDNHSRTDEDYEANEATTALMDALEARKPTPASANANVAAAASGADGTRHAGPPPPPVLVVPDGDATAAAVAVASANTVLATAPSPPGYTPQLQADSAKPRIAIPQKPSLLLL